jgi:hypothetical protein
VSFDHLLLVINLNFYFLRAHPRHDGLRKRTKQTHTSGGGGEEMKTGMTEKWKCGCDWCNILQRMHFHCSSDKSGKCVEMNVAEWSHASPRCSIQWTFSRGAISD